jgi:hypothetical protein
VAEAYRQLGASEPDRVTIVPAGDDPEAVAKEIVDLIDAKRSRR